MIVKSLGRKERCFGKLVRYLDRDAEKGAVISHNLMAGSLDAETVIAALESNADYLAPRLRANWCYHDIIALPAYAAASPNLIPMLTDLARQYLDIRAPDQMAYGRLHIDGEKPHLHLMISANAVAGTRRVRFSRQRFQAIRLQFENYKLKRWPELSEQLFGHARYGAYLSGVKEEAVARRTKRPSRREQLASELAAMFAQTHWGEELIAKLRASGLKLYRRGDNWGVKELASGRKHRFERLGLAESWSDLRQRIIDLSPQLKRARAQQSVAVLSQEAGRGLERVRNNPNK